MLREIILLLTFACLINLSANEVVEISDLKALKKFLRTHTNVLIFFRETSRSGKDWEPILKEAASQIEGRGSIVQVDCGSSKKLCKRLKANPTPTVLKHYKEGKYHKDYDRLKSSKSVFRFLEDPSSDMPWDEDETASAVTHLNSDKDLVRLVTREARPILLMFYAPWCGYCKRLKPEFAGAAHELRDEAVLAGMDVDKPDLIGVRREFNITGFPTIYYIHRKRVIYKYGGENTKESIVSWMRNPQPPKAPEEEKRWADEDAAIDIRFPTIETFDSLLKESPSVLVMFYAPWCGHCKAMKPAYAEAASKLRKEGVTGILAAVDATKESALSKRYQVQGFPTVKYFKDGELAFDVNERTTEKLVEFMKDPKEPPPPPPPEAAWSEEQSEVHHLTADNYQSFLRKKKHVLVMAYAPWCGHCKKAKPEFTRAAEAMKENRKVSFAAIDCTQSSDLCTAEGVEGFPTFLYYEFGKKNEKGYPLGRDEEDFIAFMTNPEAPKGPGQKKNWKSVKGYEDLIFLDSSNFDSTLPTKDALFVKFYAPWCGHCKAMKPAFAELATTMRTSHPAIGIGVVDATEDEALAKKFGVTGYPSLLYIRPDGTYEKYRGARTVDDMTAHIIEKQAKVKPEIKPESGDPVKDASSKPSVPEKTAEEATHKRASDKTVDKREEAPKKEAHQIPEKKVHSHDEGKVKKDKPRASEKASDDSHAKAKKQEDTGKDAKKKSTGSANERPSGGVKQEL